MRKRTLATASESSDEEIRSQNEPHTMTPPSSMNQNAQRLINKQREQQVRRRKKQKTSQQQARSSVWSTHASRITKEGSKAMFECIICGVIGAVNKNGSTSNIIKHYKIKHLQVYKTLERMNASLSPIKEFEAAILNAQKAFRKRQATQSISSFFRKASESQSTPRHTGTTVTRTVDAKLLQTVGTVLFSCATESPLSRIGSPLLQGLIDVCGGRLHFASKAPLETHLLDTYNAVCAILRVSVQKAMTGCLTVDGWSAALGAPILGMTWHFIDSEWTMRCLPISTLNIGNASKNGEQMRSIMEEVLAQSPIVGSDDIHVFSATSDNEPATALAVDLLTNYVGSVRCVVHTIALAVKDAFQNGTSWDKMMNHVDAVTKYFNQHPKAAQVLIQKQREDGITDDRIQKLRHEIPTRWHSKLGAMLTYFTRMDNIMSVCLELDIGSNVLPHLSTDQKDTLAEYIIVLGEVRRVARQLEADKKVTMSRAPRLLRELHETLLILGGNMVNNGQHGQDNLDLDENSSSTMNALPCRQSSAKADKERDEVRGQCLLRYQARALALSLADRMESRLGYIWKRVNDNAANWCPSDSVYNFVQSFEGAYTPPPSMRESKRVLLFHIAALLDVNECGLDFLDCDESAKEEYKSVVCKAVVREAIELDGSLSCHREELKAVFNLFYTELYTNLQLRGRREPSMALKFWKDANERNGLVSPVPFNRIAKASLSAQASSASAERLFSDLGRLEGNQRQSLLSGTLEMTEVIRSFVQSEIQSSSLNQVSLLHPKAFAFRKTVIKVAKKMLESAT